MDLCDFLAEDELIEIVPSFKYDKILNLINGDFGPFAPAIPTKVPMWMALNLFRQQKCKINLPQWISDLDRLNEEQANSTGLIKMPSDHWREIIKLLETHNVPMPHNHSDLIERREAILSKSVHTLLDSVVDLDDDQISQVKIRNITKFELATMKKLITANLAISKNIAMQQDHSQQDT